MACDAPLHLSDTRAEVGAFEPCRNHHQALQVFATDLVLRRQLRDGGHGAQRCRMTGTGIENRVLDRIERLPRIIAQAHANRVRSAVADERIGDFHAIEN